MLVWDRMWWLQLRWFESVGAMRCRMSLRWGWLDWSKVSPGLHPANMSSSDLYDEFWVGVGEALELILVQVHDEELVRGRQLHHHLGELLVEVADVAARFLPQREEEREHVVKMEPGWARVALERRWPTQGGQWWRAEKEVRDISCVSTRKDTF